MNDAIFQPTWNICLSSLPDFFFKPAGPPIKMSCASCYSVAEDDDAGNEWCESTISLHIPCTLTDLPWRFLILRTGQHASMRMWRIRRI
jgi:hypothetical protein